MAHVPTRIATIVVLSGVRPIISSKSSPAYSSKHGLRRAETLATVVTAAIAGEIGDEGRGGRHTRLGLGLGRRVEPVLLAARGHERVSPARLGIDRKGGEPLPDLWWRHHNPPRTNRGTAISIAPHPFQKRSGKCVTM
jgi:hypothetical protein